MSGTLSAEQVLLLQSLVAQKTKSTKWVLENPEKLKKPIENRDELVGKFNQLNSLLVLLGGTAVEALVEQTPASTSAPQINVGGLL